MDNIYIGGQSKELKQALDWWNGLEMLWKMCINEACMGKGPVMTQPTDEELMILLFRVSVFRFAGPLAIQPNVSRIPNNLSAMVGLPNLEFLSFTDSDLSSLKEVRSMKKLKSLFVYNNKLTSLDGIENLTGLEELYCQHNKITTLKPVEKLTNLRTLYVANNQLADLQGITIKHEENLRKFHVLPNESLRQREIIRVQNECGILCLNG